MNSRRSDNPTRPVVLSQTACSTSTSRSANWAYREAGFDLPEQKIGPGNFKDSLI